MNPFEVLGISPPSNRKQIDTAYRTLAMKYHPDRNDTHDAEAMMKRINVAYDMIIKGWRPAPLPMWGGVTIHVYGSHSSGTAGTSFFF